MPSLFTKLILFLSSYLPLWLIFVIQFYSKQNNIGVVISVILGAISILGLYVYLNLVRKLNKLQITVSLINRRDGEAMSYIVSYLLPFMALPSSNLGDFVSLGIFLIVLAVIYVNSDMLHINPVLNLMGWHIYEITKESGQICLLISRKKVKKGNCLDVAQIGDELYINFR
jgi:hypothetical protein